MPMVKSTTFKTTIFAIIKTIIYVGINARQYNRLALEKCPSLRKNISKNLKKLLFCGASGSTPGPGLSKFLKNNPNYNTP